MMKILILLVAFLSYSTAAKSEDLSGMMAIFPEGSLANYAELLPKKPFAKLTACLKYNTADPDEFSPFSMATPKTSHAFLVIKEKGTGPFEVFVNGKTVMFYKVPQNPPSWIHLCATWDSSSRLVQLWVDGQPSVKKLASKGIPIPEKPNIILGQAQSSYGDMYSRKQMFVGHIADLHVWDRVVVMSEVEQVGCGLVIQLRDVLEWGALGLTIAGHVYVENSHHCLSTCKAVHAPTE